MTKQERLDAAQAAYDLVGEAWEHAEAAVKGMPDEAHYRAYLLQTFKTLRGGGNPYDASLPKLIDDILRLYSDGPE